MISSWASFSLFLDSHNQVWSCGDNSNGELGLKDLEPRSVPTRIAGLENIRRIAAGYDHSLALDSQGQVFSFGGNGEGQLGITEEEFEDRFSSPEELIWGLSYVCVPIPIRVPRLHDCIDIMCGYLFSVVHLSDRRVMVFGDNTHHQLGTHEESNEVLKENPDLIDKILVPGAEYMLVGDLNGDLLCYGKIYGWTVAPSTGIKLQLPAYPKKLGKKPQEITS